MAAEVRPVPGKAALPVSRPWLVTVAVMIANLMQVLDATIANVAIPHMQASLGATIDEVSWVLTSYIIASAVAMPIIGWLSDRIGSRNLFLLCVAGFVLASMLCGISTSIEEMVLFRILQGVFGAALSPMAQTVLMDINPPEKQVMAISIWATGVMIGPVMGPMLGGWLTDSYDWRWVFFINVPLGIICFALLWALLPSRPVQRRPFDLLGFFMLTVALSAVQLMFDRGSSKDWFDSWEIRIELLIVLSFGWMFIFRQIHAENPLINRSMLKNRNFALGMLLSIILGAIMMSVTALLPTMLQNIYGHDVLSTGILLTPRGLGVMAAMYLSGRLIAYFDARMVIACGFLMVAYSAWATTQWSLEMGWVPVATNGLIQGVGLGLVFVPLNAVTFATLPMSMRTEAASIVGLARSMGGSIGISLVTTLLARNLQTAHEDMAGSVTQFTLPVISPHMMEAFGTQSTALLAALDMEINRQALMIAYLDDFVVITVWSLISIPFLILFRKLGHQSRGGAPAIDH